MIRRYLSAVGAWVERHWVEFFGAGALLLLLLFVLWPLIVYTIPPGHVGVMWYRFLGGTVTEPGEQLGEGIHFILPWDKIYIYDARLQRISEEVVGLSVDGLDINVHVTTRFVIEDRYAGFLHKGIGPDYAQTLMRPQLRTLILTYISEHEAADLYSTRRSELQAVVSARFQAALANISANVPFDESYIRLEDVLIEEILLPPFVRAAIEQKERVRHMAEAYEFRLRLEERERQRKRIEAEGIRSFQEIVAPGITDSYLRWRGIEATLQLSQSNNAKVIVIGGADGLPIILNADPGLNTALPGPSGAATTAAPGAAPSAAAAPGTGAAGSPAPSPAPPGTLPHGTAPGPLGSAPGALPPQSDLFHAPSLAGPAPLTASGAALDQALMEPPGLHGYGTPSAPGGPGASVPGTPVPGSLPAGGAAPTPSEGAPPGPRTWLQRLIDDGSAAVPNG